MRKNPHVRRPGSATALVYPTTSCRDRAPSAVKMDRVSTVARRKGRTSFWEMTLPGVTVRTNIPRDSLSGQRPCYGCCSMTTRARRSRSGRSSASPGGMPPTESM